jgi:endonuclease IV
MQNLNIPKFVHINYFVNLANDTPVIPKSISENLAFADNIGATGLVIHMGSNKDTNKGMNLTIFNITEAIAKFKNTNGGFEPKTKILIETTSEGGSRIKWDKIVEFIKKYKDELNVKICLDTAHIFAAGYTSQQIVEMIENYHELIELVHLNNPSPNVEFGKHKDQHDIPLFDASGKFSKIEIENFITICKLYDIPMILETGDVENDFAICEKNYL